ncbi:shikimate dehydrogenase [bacterium]|nr:shikimate dehydrogenase [bacterium]RQV95534.1 MAG: shikimate dehydrogenase [bacterium]
MTEKIQNTYCVIGDPIEHSLSPDIHNFVFKELDLPLRYETVRVPTNRLALFVQDCRKMGRPGWNVTIPNKQAIMPFLDEVDPLAKRIGAVNTVVNRNGKLTGYNTDVDGFRSTLRQSSWSPSLKGKVIVLGAGGAARAVIEGLASMGVHEVILYDLIVERIKQIQHDFMKLSDLTITIGKLENSDLEKQLAEIDLLVNATPVGMWPKENASPVHCPEQIQPTATVFDLVYKPVETLLLRQARSRGAQTLSGLTMLTAQALASDEIWLERNLPKTLFDKVYQHVFNQMEKNE